MKQLRDLPPIIAAAAPLLLFACSSEGGGRSSGESSSTIGDVEGGEDVDSTTSGASGSTGCPPSGCLDLSGDSGDAIGECDADEDCTKIDLLFVIDNSGTMGEEQRNLAANFPLLIDKLQNLENSAGIKVHPSVNIMVTTSDIGHPICAAFQPEGYEPAKGAPVASACTERLTDFTSIENGNPHSVPEACTEACPAAVVPEGPFIRFDARSSNVAGEEIAAALSCIGPQGINGCGHESQLESMFQALNPNAQWNQGTTPFLRDDAVLAIAMITDEVDCSVAAPEGYRHFTDPATNEYWEPNPDSEGRKTQPTAAVCWNAGVECDPVGADGSYPACRSVDRGVLHPTDRYIELLKSFSQNKDVIMLGILGVPPVTEHNDEAPYQPTAGGVFDLVYRDWIAGDILAGDAQNAGQKQWEFGIGPGCTNEGTGQAVPPVRIKEVCESLNGEAEDEIRCCIESICDDDFSAAINCLTGILQEVVVVE